MFHHGSLEYVIIMCQAGKHGSLSHTSMDETSALFLLCHSQAIQLLIILSSSYPFLIRLASFKFSIVPPLNVWLSTFNFCHQCIVFTCFSTDCLFCFSHILFSVFALETALLEMFLSLSPYCPGHTYIHTRSQAVSAV